MPHTFDAWDIPVCIPHTFRLTSEQVHMLSEIADESGTRHGLSTDDLNMLQQLGLVVPCFAHPTCYRLTTDGEAVLNAARTGKAQPACR